jgi:hypothetical protein
MNKREDSLTAISPQSLKPKNLQIKNPSVKLTNRFSILDENSESQANEIRSESKLQIFERKHFPKAPNTKPKNQGKLMVLCGIKFGLSRSSHQMLLDCGADNSFIDRNMVARLEIPLVELDTPVNVRVVDGTISRTGRITHKTIPLQLEIDRHTEFISFYVTTLSYPFIVGHSWLFDHNPQINWTDYSLEFNSQYCLQNCVSGT